MSKLTDWIVDRLMEPHRRAADQMPLADISEPKTTEARRQGNTDPKFIRSLAVLERKYVKSLKRRFEREPDNEKIVDALLNYAKVQIELDDFVWTNGIPKYKPMHIGDFARKCLIEHAPAVGKVVREGRVSPVKLSVLGEIMSTGTAYDSLPDFITLARTQAANSAATSGCIGAIEKFKDPRVLAVFEEMLMTAAPDSSMPAILITGALGKMRTPPAEALLLKLFRQAPDHRDGALAAEQLLKMGNKEVLPSVRAMVVDTNRHPSARLIAMQSLVMAGDRDSEGYRQVCEQLVQEKIVLEGNFEKGYKGYYTNDYEGLSNYGLWETITEAAKQVLARPATNPSLKHG